MTELLKNALDVINNDANLANNVILSTVVENIKNKANQGVNDYSLLKDLKHQLTGVNEYLKNKKLEDILNKITESMETSVKGDIHFAVNMMYNEIDIVGEANIVRGSTVYSEPVVKDYIDKLLLEMQYTKMPSFKYIPGFVSILQPYSTNDVVKESLGRVNGYIDSNHSKLIILETVYYLESMNVKFYNSLIRSLKGYVVEGQYSADVIKQGLKDQANVPIVASMLNSLKMLEQQKNPHFDIGNGDGSNAVYNLVGPVIRENKSMVALINDTFFHITPDDISEAKNNYINIVGETGSVKVCEIKPEIVQERHPDFYNFAKSFQAVGFSITSEGLRKDLKNNISIQFIVNEGGDLELFINKDKIEDPKTIDFNKMLVIESRDVKLNLINVLEHMENIYNIEFIKFIVNENKRKTAMIINISNDYYVYDFLGENSKSVFKLDGYKLYKYISENFNYDVSDLFSIQIDDAHGRIKTIDLKKQQVQESIAKLEDSMKTIDETMAKEINEKDRKELGVLREKVEKELVHLNNAYIVLDGQKRGIIESDASGSEDYKVGSIVTVEESGMNGRIIAADTTNDSYMIMTDDNKTHRLNSDAFKPIKPAVVVEGSQPDESAQDDDDSGNEKAADNTKETSENGDSDDDSVKEGKVQEPAKTEKPAEEKPAAQPAEEPASQPVTEAQQVDDRNKQIDFILKSRKDYTIDKLNALSDEDVYKIYTETQEKAGQSVQESKTRYDLVAEAMQKSDEYNKNRI